MKREIKFRAWDGEEMRETFSVQSNGDGINYSGDIINNWVLMQYTGLKDKNEVEIYEGDIVHSSYEIKGAEDGQEFFNTGKYKHDFYKVVEFKDGAFWSGSLMKGKTHEVIGNIYENHELL